MFVLCVCVRTEVRASGRLGRMSNHSSIKLWRAVWPAVVLRKYTRTLMHERTHTHTHRKRQSSLHAIMCLRLCYFYTLMTSIIDSRFCGLLPAATWAYEQHLQFWRHLLPAATILQLSTRNVISPCFVSVALKSTWLNASTYAYVYTHLHTYTIL